jgi:hypothetical protein
MYLPAKDAWRRGRKIDDVKIRKARSRRCEIRKAKFAV